jgi:hypothetical protein
MKEQVSTGTMVAVIAVVIVIVGFIGYRTLFAKGSGPQLKPVDYQTRMQQMNQQQSMSMGRMESRKQESYGGTGASSGGAGMMGGSGGAMGSPGMGSPGMMGR